MSDLQKRFNFEGIDLMLGILVHKEWVEIGDNGLVGIKMTRRS